MSNRIDHIAIRTADFDNTIDLLQRTCSLRLLRIGTIEATGHRMAMLGDGTGMKLELIEAPEIDSPALAHIAMRVDNVDVAYENMQKDNNWSSTRAPRELKAAHARSALLQNNKGLFVQLISYESTSPDIAEWENSTEPES